MKNCKKEKNNYFAKTKEAFLIKEIDAIDKMEESNPIDQVNSNKRLSLKANLGQITFKEAQFWAKRAKRVWLKEWDENTTYFPKAYIVRQLRNFIPKITDDKGFTHGTNITIADTFINHFKHLFNGYNKEHLL